MHSKINFCMSFRYFTDINEIYIRVHSSANQKLRDLKYELQSHFFVFLLRKAGLTFSVVNLIWIVNSS